MYPVKLGAARDDSTKSTTSGQPYVQEKDLEFRENTIAGLCVLKYQCHT